jgi:uncharacterized protein (DUF1778 family)
MTHPQTPKAAIDIHARHGLLDQRLFPLPDEEFLAFEKALAAPVGDVAALRKLLAEKTPWEE